MRCPKMIRNKLYASVLSATLLAGPVLAEPEVTGKITHESARFTETGTSIGDSTSHGKDNFKAETSARIYIDGALEDEAGSTYHLELQAVTDSKAVSGLDTSEAYTQRDPLREAYIDTSYGDWMVRAGKQQAVWGTADGIKLLDIINPTDFSEMAQNQMEDSRIPVWMLNSEKINDDGSSFQFIVSQPRENIFAGLDRNISTAARNNGASDSTTGKAHEQGAPFMLKGVDTIVGQKNGFLNIVPDLASVAHAFSASSGAFSQTSLDGITNMTVGYFVNNYTSNVGVDATTGLLTLDGSGSETGTGGTAMGALNMFDSLYDTKLANYGDSETTWNITNPNSTFEYMDRALFSTFDTFTKAKSQYVYDMPSDADVDTAIRYKNTTEGGTNYSLVYSHNYDKNPVIDLSWRNDAGQKLTVKATADSSGATGSQYIDVGVAEGLDIGYDSTSASGYGLTSDGAATLRFTQTLKRAHNLGAAMDTTFETEEFGPVVVRAEALYQKDVYSPIMDRGQLATGNLTEALKMTKGDRFKYVIGADITALTNMMVSFQFIQDRNLDYIDNNVDWDGGACTSSDGANCGVYTADFAAMHLSNGLQKAEKNKEFYSLYLSKPFGESGQHRWNNIFMFEENGGKWNRLDAEFTIDDNTVATAEYNKYWGDANTQFGQLEKSSNIQLGIKYSF